MEENINLLSMIKSCRQVNSPIKLESNSYLSEKKKSESEHVLSWNKLSDTQYTQVSVKQDHMLEFPT